MTTRRLSFGRRRCSPPSRLWLCCVAPCRIDSVEYPPTEATVPVVRQYRLHTYFRGESDSDTTTFRIRKITYMFLFSIRHTFNVIDPTTVNRRKRWVLNRGCIVIYFSANGGSRPLDRSDRVRPFRRLWNRYESSWLEKIRLPPSPVVHELAGLLQWSP